MGGFHFAVASRCRYRYKSIKVFHGHPTSPPHTEAAPVVIKDSEAHSSESFIIFGTQAALTRLRPLRLDS